jgi:hypothetical protein
MYDCFKPTGSTSEVVFYCLTPPASTGHPCRAANSACHRHNSLLPKGSSVSNDGSTSRCRKRRQMPVSRGISNDAKFHVYRSHGLNVRYRCPVGREGYRRYSELPILGNNEPTSARRLVRPCIPLLPACNSGRAALSDRVDESALTDVRAQVRRRADRCSARQWPASGRM